MTRFGTPYRIYVLLALLVAYTVSYMDRIVIAALLPQIKTEMLLADWQLGLLIGFAFAFFYSVFGLPIARWADSGNRVSIIALGVALWSVMTAVGGMAPNYASLLAARIGVAVGEAGCTPPAHSIIGDLFSVARRSSAIAVYSLGPVLGASLGILLGGVLGAEYGWRLTLVALGLPGLLLALLLRLTLREPPRGMAEQRVSATEPPGLAQTIALLWSRPTYRCLGIGISLAAIGSYGNQLWLPSFLQRTHGLDSAEIGRTLSLLILAGSALGALAGGFFADLSARHDRRWQLWLPGAAMVLMLPLCMLTYLADSLRIAWCGIFVMQIASMIYMGPVYANTQLLVGLRMRAVASAFTLLLVSVIGLGIGPLAIGALSDALHRQYGEDSLRWALCTFLLFQIGAGLMFVRAARTLEADLARAPDAPLNDGLERSGLAAAHQPAGQ